MKHLPAALALLITAPAHAGVISLIPNTAGGVIEITDEACTGEPGGVVMAEVGDTGRVVTGCWVKVSSYILIHWSSGETMRYPVNATIITDYGRATYGDSEQQKAEVEL